MGARSSFTCAALAALLLTASPLGAQRVILLPAVGRTSASSFGAEPFAAANSFTVGAGAFAAFTNPAATRYFIVSSANITVVDANGAQVQTPVSLGRTIAAATITGDGRKVLVAAGTTNTTLYVFDITGGTMVQTATAVISDSPLDVLCSMDSSTAYVLTATGVTPVNLATNALGASLSLSGLAAPRSGIVQGPSGYLYVNADSALYEIDITDLSLRKTINIVGFPNKPTITPDNKAVMANPAAAARTDRSLMVVNLSDYTTSASMTAFGPMFTKLIWTGLGKYYALATSNSVLYQLNDSLADIGEAVFAGGVTIAGVLDVFTSNELPLTNTGAGGPRYMFVLSVNGLYRIDLRPPTDATADQIVKTLGYTPAYPISGAYLAPASVNTPAGYVLYGNDQQVVAGKNAAPLVLRTIDSAGHPTSGVPVTFSAGAGILQKQMTGTNSSGFAMAISRAPLTGESLIVTATLPAVAVIYFNLSGVAAGSGTTTTTTTTTGISILNGNGQGMLGNYQVAEPVILQVTDANNAPLALTAVNLAIVGGAGLSGVPSNPCQVITNTSVACATDSNGLLTLLVTVPSLNDQNGSFLQSEITASIAISNVDHQTAVIYATAFPQFIYGGQLQGRLQWIDFMTPGTGGTLTAQSGLTTLAGVKMGMFAQSGQNSGAAVPNLGLLIRQTRSYCPVDSQSDECLSVDLAHPPAHCAGGVTLTGADGIAICDVVVPATTAPGTYEMWAIAAGNSALHFYLKVTAAPPPVPVVTTVTVLSGDGQTGPIGSTVARPLIGVVKDQFGHTMTAQTVTWAVVSGSASLVAPTATETDSSGQAGTGLRFGNIAGPVQVRLTAGSKSVTFTATSTVSIGTVTKVSGDNQSVVVGQAFAPISVIVKDAQGVALSGISVAFNLTSGVATPTSAAVTTGADGIAAATFTASSVPGPITITASAGGITQTFTLTARLPGPVLTAASFMNGASFQPGVAFGAVIAIKGVGLTTGLNLAAGSCLSGIADGFFERGLPTTLAGMQIQFGSQIAPIFAICKNADNTEQVNVQAPFELAPTPNLTVAVKIGVGSGAEVDTYVNGIRILNAQPGIFEYNVDASTRYAIAVRPDGSLVSPSNQARRGETIVVYVTGLGPVLPSVRTNQTGSPSQTPFFATSVQVNGAGVPGVTVQYASGRIGVFAVNFIVPSDAAVGLSLPITVTVLADGLQVASPASRIAIQ